MAFTRVQNGSTLTGSTTASATTISLTLPVASTAGTLIVASFVLGAAGFPLKITSVAPGGGPNTSPGWEWCGTGVNGSGGGGEQIEVWCYRNNPGGITGATWVMANGGGARGHLAEYSSTLAWQVMELFPGVSNSVTPGDTSFPVSMGNPVGAGELAVATFGDNFTPSTAATWTTPAGWTLNRDTSGSTFSLHWASYYKVTAAAGAVSVTGVISTATNQLGWEGIVVVFRETASVASRVGCSISPGTYNDQASFGFPATKTGSAKEFDVFVGRPMAVTAQVSYQHEGAHLTTGPTGDLNELTAMGAQVCWSLKPNRNGVSGFTTLAAEQAAVDNDLALVRQSGITGFFCCLYNEYNLGGANGPFGNDTGGSDPYGTGNTDATAKTHWLAYWGNYQPILAAHGIPCYTKPSYASPNSCSAWHPPAGTVSGVMADFYYSDSDGKQVYLDQSPSAGVPSLQDVCDGVRNPDNTVPSPLNTPIPLGIGEVGRAAGPSFPAWSLVVAWSHTGGNTGHLRDLFKARLTAGKQNAPVLWFTNNINGPNWIHTPGVNGEDQTGIQAELAAWADNLAPQAAGTTVAVTTTTLPDAALGVAYSQALQVTGGSAPYTWALLTGTLPTGLSLSAAGVISGTPTVAGTYTFTVKATDAGSNIGNSGTLSILVPGMAVTTTSLPAASVGVAYTTTLTETGGTGPFTWSVPAGGLPAGITLAPSTGVLSGTTGAPPGPYPVTVVVTDSLSGTAQAALTLTVSAGATGGGAPAPPAFGYPQLAVEAGFYTATPVVQPGTFILGDTVNGILGVGVLSDGTAWTDISKFVRSGRVIRASTRVQGPLRTYQAGTGSVDLDNADGRFDSANLSGPYVTGGVSNIRPMVPLRVRAIFGSVAYNVFSGFADTWQEDPVTYDAGWSQVTVSGSDGFKVLAGITLPPAPQTGNNQPSGSRIRKILTDAGWFTDHRRIDDGNTVLQGTVYGDTVLNLLQLAADTEIGELYIDGGGNLTFRERQAVLTDTRSTTPQAVFGDLPGTAAGAGATGAFLSAAAMGEPSYTAAVTDWATWTGSPLAVSRQYYALSSFPTADANLTYDIAHGIKCCIDLRPAYNPTSSTDLANLTTMLAAWKTAGLNAEVSLWAEPFNNGLSAAQYIAMVNYYGPAVRAYYPLVFCTSALSAQSNGENSYYPGDAAVDKIATDLYAIRWLTGTRLDTAASVADGAVPPKPFGLWEFGAAPKGSNLLAGDNANFEVTFGTWTGAGNATTPRSTLQAHTGIGSLAVTSVAAGTMDAAHCAAANIAAQGLPCVPGDQIACSAWVMAATAARTVQAGANFYTSGGAFISSLFDTGNAITDSTSAWAQVGGTVTAPATAAFCRLDIRVLSTAAAAEVHYLDDCSLGNLNTGQSQADVTSYFAYLQSYFTGRAAAGKNNADLIMFNSGGASGPNATIVTPVLSAADYRVSLWQALRDAMAPLAFTELTLASVSRANDDTQLANDVQITRAGGTLQEAQDAASIAKFLFPRSYSRSDVILQSDSEALTYAQWVLYVSSAGEDRFDSITIDPVADPPSLFPQVLAREIGDRIMVYRRPQNSGTTIARPCFIRGITHSIDVAAGTWSTTWDLQDATRYAGFLILGDATKGKLNSGNKLAY
jgi:Putative Ig domain